MVGLREVLEESREEEVRVAGSEHEHKLEGGETPPDGRGLPRGHPAGQRRQTRGMEGRKSVHEGNKQSPAQQIDHRALFYEKYHKEAEDFDKEFMKKYDEDLNTTLIFAGLFSAVTSAFIIDIQPQLQPDRGEETTELLRILIQTVKDPTSSEIPPLPQWTGPSGAIVQVQSVLYSSLAATIFSAFLAMLGKQWLNRYTSVDMRGSAIERNQHRQRKLNGMFSWYFNVAMESLPLMLQLALLLLGCALSRYLWTIDHSTACVILGFTSLGVLFYLSILVAGSIYESCPYQTPGSQIIRYIQKRLLPEIHGFSLVRALRPLRSLRFPRQASFFFQSITPLLDENVEWWKKPLIALLVVVTFPILLWTDILGLIWALSASVRSFYTWASAAWRRDPPIPDIGRGEDYEIHVLDSHCVAWMLDTSMDRHIHRITLEFLETLRILITSDTSLFTGCLNILSSCIHVDREGNAVLAQGLEELGKVAAMALLHVVAHFSVMMPASSALHDVRQKYRRIYPIGTDFRGISFHRTLKIMHSSFYPHSVNSLYWMDYEPSTLEHISMARKLVLLTWLNHQREGLRFKVPRWTLRFVLHTLMQDTPPPTPVIADCLLLVALELDHEISMDAVLVGDKSAMIDDLVEYIVTRLEEYTMPWHRMLPNHKAITTLFVYATRREQDGDPRLLAAFLKVSRHFPQPSSWLRYRIGAVMSELLEEESSNLQKRAAVLAAPSVPQSWKPVEDKGGFINSWLSAVDRVKEMGDVTEGAIRMSFDMAWDDEWRPHMTPEAWALLKWDHQGRPLYWKGAPLIVESTEVIPAVRSLGDVEILTSFLILTWLGLDAVSDEMTDQMCVVLWEEYGIGKDVYRGELLRCLDRVLEYLNGMQYGRTPMDRLRYQNNDSASSNSEDTNGTQSYGRTPMDRLRYRSNDSASSNSEDTNGMQYGRTPMVRPWYPNDDLEDINRRLDAYVRLRKELLDVERAAVVARTNLHTGHDPHFMCAFPLM